MPDLIFHHYDVSPFSEKVRVLFGIKGLAWRSVIQPIIMPKPELLPLTGGYRRIPVMQIGADVYCDTQVIMAELEQRFPDPQVISGADFAVNLTCDRLWFQATVTCVFSGATGLATPEFIADRERLSGRPFDVNAMSAAAPAGKAQWRGMAAWTEGGLERSGAPYLGGAAPSLADVAAYMNVWWLWGANRALAAELLKGFERTLAWRERMRALGHGDRSELSPADALAVARAAEPGPAPAHDPSDASGFKPGDAVRVMADDYGRDPIASALVAATPDRYVVARDDADLRRIHIHVPRVGFHLVVG